MGGTRWGGCGVKSRVGEIRRTESMMVVLLAFEVQQRCAVCNRFVSGGSRPEGNNKRWKG